MAMGYPLHLGIIRTAQDPEEGTSFNSLKQPQTWCKKIQMGVAQIDDITSQGKNN